MRRLVLAAAILCLFAPTARADHITAAATIELSDIGPAERGARNVRVTWSVTCSPEARPVGSVFALIKPKNPGLAPHPLDPDGLTIDGEDALSGHQDYVVQPGRTAFAEVRATCRFLADDGTDHEAAVTARSPTEVAVPPRLAAVVPIRGTWCDAERARRRGQLQALQFYRVQVYPVFDPFSMLRGRGRASYDEVIVQMRGAGLSRGSRVIVKRTGLFVDIRPRRPGKLRFWMELGGVKTDERSVRVVGIRGGCRREALAIPL